MYPTVELLRRLELDIDFEFPPSGGSAEETHGTGFPNETRAAIDAAEERKAQHAAQAAERQPRAESQPQPEDAPQPETPAGDAAAEVVDLSPAKLSEMVQEEQDSASTG